VLGATAGVVALTKQDLVDEETLRRREREVEAKLKGTALENADIVTCSSATGEAPPEDRGRPRVHIDRSFTIRGAGTVVTGTLTGGTLSVGDEVQLHPQGTLARIRSLQTHRRPVQVARPVSRVAANLAGVPKAEVERGDALTRPNQWRATSLVEARVFPVVGFSHSLTSRGAYKVYAGSAERDARISLYAADEVAPGQSAYARIRLSRAIVVEVGDRFVLREAGRRQTVAGGVCLDPDPPSRLQGDPRDRLARREAVRPADLPSLVVSERGAVRDAELPALTGFAPPKIPGATRVGAWWVTDKLLHSLADAAQRSAGAYHREHPLRGGLDATEVRRALFMVEPSLVPALEQGLASAVIASLEEKGALAREGTMLRLASHRVTLDDRGAEAARLVQAVREGEPTPPNVRELEEVGFSRELIDAACRTGRLVRVSPDVVVTPEFARRAEDIVRVEAARPEGITVSRFRELLGTTRRFALPFLERFDAEGLTRREGDVRRLR